MEPMHSLSFAGSAELKKRIMRRVHLVWFWKHIAPVVGVELILLLGVAAGVLTHIAPRQILMNALHASASAQAFVLFFVRNFFVKSIQSQLLVLAYGAILGFFVRDIRSALKRLRVGSEEFFFASRAEFGRNQRQA